MTHIIQTVMTGRSNRKEYKDNWIKNRVDIFKNYTLKSLLNQKNKDFVHWISFRPDDNGMAWVKELKAHLESLKDYKFVFTYDGQPYHDDRGDNTYLKKRFEWSLEVVAPYIKDNVYFTVLDSDDCLIDTAVESIQNIPFDKDMAIVMRKGYIYNLKDKKLAEWNPATNPPFYTLMFEKDTFLNPQAYLENWRAFNSHEDIVFLWKTKSIWDGSYLITTHENNKSTKWHNVYFRKHPFIGKDLTNKKDEILCQFGIE